METETKAEALTAAEQSRRQTIIGTIFVVIAGVLWGITGIFVRYFSSFGLSSLQITVFKIAFAAVAMLAYCLIFRRDMLRIKLSDIWIFMGAGFISMDFFTYCYFSTIQTTSLSTAAVLLYAAPAFVMLMSALFFKEKISAQKVFSCALAFFGCFLTAGLIGSNTAIPLPSLITGLFSALGYALYSIFGQVALNRGYKPLTITTYTFFFATIGALFMLRPDEVEAAAAKTSTLLFVGMLILMSFVVSLLPYIFYTNGLTKIRPSKASIIASVEPVTATIIGAFVFAEYPDLYGVLGIICVVGAIILLNVRRTAHADSNTAHSGGK